MNDTRTPDPAVTVIGTNLVFDYGTTERANAAMDALAARPAPGTDQPCFSCGKLIFCGEDAMEFDEEGTLMEKPQFRRSRVEDCSTCQEDPQGKAIMPAHDASENCESGKHPHCSCDTCF